MQDRERDVDPDLFDTMIFKDNEALFDGIR